MNELLSTPANSRLILHIGVNKHYFNHMNIELFLLQIVLIFIFRFKITTEYEMNHRTVQKTF